MKSKGKIRIKYISKVPENDIGFEKVKIKKCLELQNHPDGVWCLTNAHPTNVDLSLKKIHLKKCRVILKDKERYYKLYGYSSSNYIKQGKELTVKEYNLLKTIPRKFLNRKTLNQIYNYNWNKYMSNYRLKIRLEFYKHSKENS